MAYADEVLADTPIAYWRMEETAGADFVDEVSSFNLSITGADPNVSGKANLGSACFLDGIDDFLEEKFILSHLGTASVEFWFRAGLTNQPNWARLVNVSDPGGSIRIERNSGNDILRLTVGTSAGATQADTIDFDPFDDTWHHVVATADGTDMKLRVDKVERINTPYSHGTGVPFRDVQVGVSVKYLGYVDEIAVYDSALSTTRIDAHYDAAFAAADDPANLQASVLTDDVTLTWDASP